MFICASAYVRAYVCVRFVHYGHPSPLNSALLRHIRSLMLAHDGMLEAGSFNSHCYQDIAYGGHL